MANEHNKKRDHKVVSRRGGFFAAPLSEPGREARASQRERARLVRRVGLGPDGEHPGLTRGEAMGLARKLDSARSRNTRQRRGGDRRNRRR